MASLERWIARFSYSFLILAFVLGWESHRRLQGWGMDARVWAELIGAAVAAGLGMWGVRIQHRRR